jgi:hypothetical protein
MGWKAGAWSDPLSDFADFFRRVGLIMGPTGGAAVAGSESPSHASPSQYRWVSGSAGSTYQPGVTLIKRP